MRNTLRIAGVATALLFATTVQAQVVVTGPTVQITPPQITFTAQPVLVEAAPGVRVVEDHDDEVFVVNNVYWVRRDDHWFRSTAWNGRWVYVEPRRVPGAIVRIPPGHYKHWKRGGPSHVVVRGPHGGAVVVGPGHGHPHGGAVVKVKGPKGGKVKVRVR